MSSLLFTNIKQLIQTAEAPRQFLRGAEMDEIGTISNAYLLVENGKIARFGPMAEVPDRADRMIDATDRMLLPCWVDSHTHLVFAGSRELEFEDRIKGLSYEEIARRGGGILNSAQRLRDTEEAALFDQTWARMEEVRGYGTGAIEIKSGYGLSLESELKILRVIRRIKEQADVPVRATFLGAHAVPKAFKENREGYIQLLIEDLLPRIAEEGLADYIDVFCEKVAFSPAETDRILQAGARYGLRPKIHVNQFYSLGGIEVAVQHNAISVDHLEVMEAEDISILAKSNTMATILPTAPFFLNDPYPPARQMLDAGLGIALATDYNPGSTPSGRMPFVLSLACIKCRMTPTEAINAATVNGATALELADQCGTIAAGMRADLILTKPIPSLAYIPYAFGSDLIDRVFTGGGE